MDTTGYIITISLILVVFKQLKEHRLDLSILLLPVGLIAFTAHTYLQHVPTGGNDITFDLLLGGIGAALGVIGAAGTHMRTDAEGVVWARAGLLSATVWVVGIGTRLAVALFSDHGGADTLARFSAHHQITGADAWTAALVIMALTQVTVRLVLVYARREHLRRSAPSPAFAA
jgi:hypothetical protein